MKKISNIELFVRVVQDGSFSSTARELGTSPSSVSRQVSQLEEELGARLFSRTTRKQTLTEAGAIFFQRAEHIVADLKDAQLAVNRLAGKPSGLLTISAETDLAQNFLAPVLPEFLERFPDINIQIVVSPNLLDLIDGALDLAIRMGHLHDSNLIARKLMASHSVVCASPKYLKKQGMPKIPSELAHHNCLSFKTSAGVKKWCFKSPEEKFEVSITGRVSVNSIAFLRSMVVAGQGIGMMPKWNIEKQLASGELVPLLEDYTMIPDHTPIHAVYNQTKQLPPKVRVFIDFMVEKYEDLA
jgi:DNA-binding transcriptional LysR family regulator